MVAPCNLSFVSIFGSEKNRRELAVSNSILCSSSGDCWILTGSGAYSEELDPDVEISTGSEVLRPFHTGQISGLTRG